MEQPASSAAQGISERRRADLSRPGRRSSVEKLLQQEEGITDRLLTYRLNVGGPRLTRLAGPCQGGNFAPHRGELLTLYGHMIETDDSATEEAIPDFGVRRTNL